MEAFYIYIVKVNMAIAVFYFLYRMLFNRDTFLGIRRFFLLTIIGLAFTYPFITLSAWLESREPLQAVVIDYTNFFVAAEAEVVAESVFTFENVLWGVYIAGFLFLTVRLAIQFISLLQMGMKGRRVEWSGTQVIALQEKTAPFSFFGWIFVNPACHDDRELEEIIAHEKAHVYQRHSLDMLAGEILCILFWFNPAVWLARYEIRQNLEFLADKDVVKSGYNRKNYQYHLLRLSHQSVATQIVNNFNVSQLKKRIAMMNKKKTSRLGLMKYALLLPVTGLLVLSGSAEAVIRVANKAVENALPAAEEVTMKGRVIDENGKPMGGVSVIINSENIGTSTDSEGRFSIQGNEADVLVFSFVGKASQKVTIRDGGKDLEVIMRTVPTRLNDLVVVGYAQEKKSDKKVGEETVFVVVEDMPSFPGGDRELMSFLARNVKYPVKSQENGVEGQVLVSFVVGKDGKVRDQKIVRGVDAALDKEALRVVGVMPDWKPGKQRGQAVDVMFTLPVDFRLAGGDDGMSGKTGLAESPTSLSDSNILRLNGLSKVLIIVDGKEMPAGYDLKNVKHDTIESITVLKDETSIRIYGEKGREGVIVITTKKK